MNPELAQQRQQEVRAVLRNPLRDGLEVMACWRTTRALSEHFFPSLHRASRQVDLPLDTLFQYILYELYHSCKSDGLQNEEGSKQCHDLFFDGQHAQGNIPMHQAKVLDRSARLPMVDLQERLSKVWSKEQLLQMIHHVSSLRSLLRMKVEDANDLSMAHKTVLLIHEYLSYLIALSRAYRGREEDPHVADCGTTCVADKPVDDELWTLYSEGVPANAKSMHGSGFQGALQFDLSSTLPQGLAELPPRPEREDLDQARDLEGIVCYVHAALPMLLSDVNGSIPVSLRIQILDDLQAWIPLLFSNTSVSTHPSLFDSLPLALVTQLEDKRSQVVKSTCQVIQVSLDQGTRCHPSWDESRRTLLRKVLPGLLNGVPVTVNAIATPCHSAMRICLLSAAQLGCITAQVMDLLHDALAHRGQVVLKRRALEYATLLLLHVHHPSWDAVETAQRLHLTSVKERDEGGERQHKNPIERVLEWLMALCTAVTHASAEVRKAARREWVVWWELLRNAAFMGPPSKNDSDLLYEQVQDSVPLEKRCAHETSCDANHVIEALHKFMDIIAKSQIHAQEKTGSGCATQDNVFSDSFATIHSTIRSLTWATLVSEYQSELGTEPVLWASNLESIIWAPSGSPISTNTCVAKGGTPTHLQNKLGISKTSSRVSLRDRIALREKMQAKEE